MTQAEYTAAYKAAHRLSGRITSQTIRELQKVFLQAGDLVAAQVAATEFAGLSSLTSSAWLAIERQLVAGAGIISEAIVDTVPLSISKAYTNYLNIDAAYIGEAAAQAGSLLITDAGVRNMGISVDFRLLQAHASRIYQDGFTFSERVWRTFGKDGLPVGANGDFQYRIKNLILTGEAQGRDPIDIADDIQVYIKRGKDFTFREGRYGKLEPGTAAFKARIAKRIDWRALRLVRSEMNASLQQAGVIEGIVNPAATGFYDWVKTVGNPIDIDGANTASGLRCIDLDRNSPYAEEEVPGYNHSNCSCHVRPALMDQRVFVEDLKEWTPGGGPTYLDNWYSQLYLPAQAA